jgi:hypothetical protein
MPEETNTGCPNHRPESWLYLGVAADALATKWRFRTSTHVPSNKRDLGGSKLFGFIIDLKLKETGLMRRHFEHQFSNSANPQLVLLIRHLLETSSHDRFVPGFHAPFQSASSALDLRAA